jgi:CHAT domain-containing protein
MGFSKHDPPPLMGLVQMRALFDHMLDCKQYKVAFQLAQCYAGLPEAGCDMSLLQALIDSPFDDDILRAAALLHYADSLQAQDKAEEAKKYLEASEKLYLATSHAFGLSMIHLRRLREGGAEKFQERIDAVVKIKSELEAIENWDGVRQALHTLTAINNQAPDDSLSTFLNIEYLQLRDICRNDIDWVNQRVSIARRWNFSDANIGQSLEALEKLYAEIKHMDAPIYLADIVMLLYDINTKLGDIEKAQVWLLEQRHVLPRSLLILHEMEEFVQDLQSTRSAPDPEAEVLGLQTELDSTKQIILNTDNLMDRSIEVGRISHIANIYAQQYKLRNPEQTIKLVDMCIQFIDQSSTMLSEKNGKDLKANVLQTQASIKMLEAAEPPFTVESMPGKIELFLAAGTLQQEAHDLYEDIEKWTSVSMAKAQKANCLQTAWLLQGSPTDSQYFHEATNLYVEALELSQKIHHTISVRSHTVALVKLWFKGFQKNISMPPPQGEEEVSAPILMVVKYLLEVDALTNVERNDLSALRNERSILAKQNLRKRPEFSELYDIAIKVFASIADTTPLWSWVQTAKSRGISDLLALGIILPDAITKAINEDANLVRLTEEERQRQSDLETAPPDSKFYLTKELEMHRKKMREHTPLADMLNLREGESVEIEALRSLQELRAATHVTGLSQRGLAFVDWFVYGNIFAAIVVTKTAIHAVPTGFTLEAARNWKEKYLTHHPELGHPLEDPDLTPLQELSILIKPVIDHTEDGDLLVFCPTGALHGIPLHAATLDDTSRKSIIERSPIVYTSSMTTLNHCVSRELQHSRNGPDPSILKHSFVAVFEETDGIDVDTATWDSTRDTLYQGAQDIGSKFSGSGVTVGQNVSPQVLRQSFESDMMYFFGHCNDTFDNILQQALILAPTSGEQQISAEMTTLAISDGLPSDISISTPSSIVDTGGTPSAESVATTPPLPASMTDAEPFPRFAPHHFTVGDIFRSRVQASNIMLIACGSASESNTPGDEPLGIVTALLCAGASSVIGTLWKVQAGRGMEFSRRFYDMLFNEAEAARSQHTHDSQGDKLADGPNMLLDMAVILQKVVCKMKRNKDFRVPFQWAPYMLSGSWFVQRD